MSAIAQQKVLVKEGLFQFITKHIPSADLNVIDDIVLTYVISILEEASQDPCFDVEVLQSQLIEEVPLTQFSPIAVLVAYNLLRQERPVTPEISFIEMMSAYVPQFGRIDAGLVCTWVLELEAELNQRDDTDSLSNHDDSASSDRLSLTLQNLSEMLPPLTKNNRSHSNSESSESVEGNRRPLLEEDVHAEQCQALAEMFPNTCAMEIKHCVSIAHGDVERAAATLLHRREQGQSLSAAALHTASRQPLCDDHELKNRIIARYSYVDKNSDQKEHKPLAPKIEPKKMVRYRDNKIVSLKGERYTEVPKSGADEENLKKPKKHHCP